MSSSKSHEQSSSIQSARCSATTTAGTACKAWAVRGTNPPLCSAHGGGSRPVGAPTGNRNAWKHGYYSQDPDAINIGNAIAGLTDKMNRMDGMIERAQVEGEELIHVFELYTQACSRLGRLLRDRRALSGEAADGISGAIAQALDELSTELGVDL